VTGGAGYVGSVSVERLVETGHDVVVLDDLSTGHAPAVAAEARLVEGSYADRETIVSVLDEGIEAVLHCAARSLVGESIADPGRYFQENVAGGITLLEAARQVGVRRFVFSSTAAVYGTPDTVPIPDDAPLRPINPYGETKRTFEAALNWYGVAYGFRAVSLRYFNVAGASSANGEVHRPETHLIPILLGAIESGQPMTVYGDDYPTPDGTSTSRTWRTRTSPRSRRRRQVIPGRIPSPSARSWSAIWAAAPGSASAKFWARRSGWLDGPCRRSSASDVPVIQRHWSRRRSARAKSLAGRRSARHSRR
jgi:hypothetical protein